MEDTCIEPCPLMSFMIVSVKCQECENCKSSNIEEGWIKCEAIQKQ